MVAGFFQRRCLVLLVAVGSGFACWLGLAGTKLEHAAFARVIRSYVKPPYFLSAKGPAEAPWSLRTVEGKSRIDARKAPVVVSIGDDPGGGAGRFFQDSPPSPVDLAVVLKNLQRLGQSRVAVAAILAWDQPDAIALKGLEIVLNDFEKTVHAAPLARGAVRQPMPASMRRAALAPGAIQGDISKLPVVNRVAVPDVIFGGDAALAGFSSLDEAEPGDDGRLLPLLARWQDEDRVVLAFPLLATLVSYDLPLDGIQVKLGEFLQLGPAGPVVPIDAYGRMALPIKPVVARAEVAAEALINAGSDIFPPAPGLIVLRDDQSTAPRATRRFSASLASAMAAIGSDAGLGPPRNYHRLARAWEVTLLLLASVLLAMVAGLSRFQRWLGLGLAAAVCVFSQWLAVGFAQVWLPGIPLLAAILTAALVRSIMPWNPALKIPAQPVTQSAAAGGAPPVTATLRPVKEVTAPVMAVTPPVKDVTPPVKESAKPAPKTLPRKPAKGAAARKKRR
jgi:hypothetical protein